MPKFVLIILGIFATIIFLVLIASAAANILFNQNVTREVKDFFKNVDKKEEVIEDADLKGLPACVQKWLERSQVIGKMRIQTVRLRQKGLMRTKVDGPWMPTEAEQYFTVDKPGFIWKARIRIAPLIYLTGKDKYYEGRGHMLIKLLSLYPVVNSEGKEIDQGTLLRYLAEMPWFPTAALNDYIKWEAIDSNSARATMSYNGVTASGVFNFNEEGDLTSFSAKRYRESDGKYVLTDWGGITKGYKEFNGIRIPSRTDVIWKLESGDFNWYRCEITEIDYNKPFVY